jgi:hypothetical protein
MNMKSQINSGYLWVSTAIFLLVSSAQADTSAFTSAGFTTNQPASFTGTRGWNFQVNNSYPYDAISITELGVFDSGGDGLDNPHQVGLWTTDGTLLASATVPAGSLAPLVDGYRYVSIAPVTVTKIFSATFGYIIAAQYSAGDTDDLVTPVSGALSTGVFPLTGSFPAIGRYGLGPGLPFPNQPTIPMEGSIGPGFWEPNFQFVAVPEPSVFAFFALGSLLLGWPLFKPRI